LNQKSKKAMQRTGPIMIIEDDMDDQELLEETFSILNYPNPVIFFKNGHEAIQYLHKAPAPPVLIISDINMPVMDGFEIKEKIMNTRELQQLQIPFVFFTTAAQQTAVTKAHRLSDQGFFMKPNTMEELQQTIKLIVEYWLGCYTPGLYSKNS
jgi:CheY-like chemotaxis protein